MLALLLVLFSHPLIAGLWSMVKRQASNNSEPEKKRRKIRAGKNNDGNHCVAVNIEVI